MMMFVSIVERGFPGDGHYRWLRGPINPLPMELNRVPRSHHSSHSRFFAIVIYPLSRLKSCNSPEAIQAEMLTLKFDFILF